MRKFVLLLLVCCCLLQPDSFAAFPVREPQKQERATQKLYQRVNESSAKYRSHALNEEAYSDESTDKEDSGIYGILSLVFGLLGIFPAAIVLGVVGMEKHRKYRELAVAGLILGIVTLFIFLLFLGFLFLIMGL